MSKKSFKIITGFDKSEYYRIEKDELSRAYHCFLTDGQMITKEGVALRGRNILRIEPNWNEVMGYTQDYKLTGEDHLLIGEKRKRFANNIMAKAKEIAGESIETGNVQLLNQEINSKLLAEGGTSENAKLLAAKLK